MLVVKRLKILYFQISFLSAVSMESVISSMESLMVTLEGEQGRLPYHFQSLRNKLSAVTRMQSYTLNYDSDSDSEW